MERHKIGTQAGGITGMSFFTDLLQNCQEPESAPVSYEVLDTDLNGIPVEAGFGSTIWRVPVMRQADYNFILDLQGDVAGVQMYVRSAKRSGASGIDFANYLAVVGRPTFGRREGLVLYDIEIPITGMIEQ